jgi:uncharacterized protein YjaG (DUF416 family)
MSYRFDRRELAKAIAVLTRVHKLAFGIFMLERALPDFLRFQQDTSAPGGAVIRAILANCWSHLERPESTIRDVTLAECEAAIPDSEKYASPYTSAAIDAGTIACSLQEFLHTGMDDLLLDAAQARIDTVDMFLQQIVNFESGEPGFEEAIRLHPMMQAELRLLSEDLNFLAKIDGRTDTLLRETLNRVFTLGYGQFRLIEDGHS